MEDDGTRVPKLPIAGKRNILITSALPSVTKLPHLADIIQGVLSADVYARYCRLRGYNVMYICGTNDYGPDTEAKALEENLTPQEICDKYHAIHQRVYDWFDISFDMFGQTSTQKHTQVCLTIYNKLLENGLLLQETTRTPQLYCGPCNKYLTNQHLEGRSPLDLSDVGHCKFCQTRPRFRSRKQLMFDLPKLEDRLEVYLTQTSPRSNLIAMKSWGGLIPMCFTNDLVRWGVPVPLERYEDKVFDASLDVPIGYVSITACYTSEWEAWWKNPSNVELHQFMGIYPVLFHTLTFPAIQLGTGENWTMMKTTSVAHHLSYEGKFSEWNGVGVFGDDVKDTNIPVGVWRYYLLTKRPEGQGSTMKESVTKFKWDELQAKLKGHLVCNLGNFVHRILSFIAKPENAGYGSVIPDAPGAESHLPTKSLAGKIGELVKKYVEHMEKIELKQGLAKAMRISREGNLYLEENQIWRLYGEDKSACAAVTRTAAGVIHLLAQLLEPFMPSFSREVFRQLNLPPHFSLSDERGEILRASKPWEILPPSHRIGTPLPLFKELGNEEVQGYRERFG